MDGSRNPLNRCPASYVFQSARLPPIALKNILTTRKTRRPKTCAEARSYHITGSITRSIHFTLSFTMMFAEMPTISDEKKTPDVEDDKVAEAEYLAADALRLAEEAKRAAERLAEIKAIIHFLAKGKPKLELKVQVEEETEKRQQEDAPAGGNFPATPRTLASPENSLSSPVSIMKTVNAEKGGTKEVRYAPDTVDPAEAKKAAEASQKRFDPIVKLYDAVGIDKICGLQFDEEEEPPMPPKKQGLSQEAMQAMIDSKTPSESASYHQGHEILSPSRRAFLARQYAMGADPFETVNLGAASSIEETDSIEETTKEVNPVSETRDPAVTAPVEDTSKETTTSPVEETSEKTATSSVEETSEEAGTSTASPEPVTEVKPVVEEPAPTRAKVDPPTSGKNDVAVPVAVAEVLETPAAVEPTAGETKEVPVVETVTTPVDQPSESSPVESPPVVQSHSSYQQEQLWIRNYNYLGDKADPFSGEDGIDCMCGSGDAAFGATAFPDEEELAGRAASLPTSNSVFCGWGS